MYTTSPTLIGRIKDLTDDESWREFYVRYTPLIYSVARRQGLDDADAEDVVQAVMLGVANGIERYDRSRGQFRRWLLGATFNKIRDVLARRGPQALSDSGDLPQEPQEDDPFVRMWESEWRKRLLQEAVDKVRRQGDDRAFQAFWLRVVAGWKVDAVAADLGLKPQRVYEYKHRIARRIAQEYEAIYRAADEE